MKKAFFSFFIFSFLFFSCKKSHDEEMPIINIVSPVNGFQGNVNGLIHVNIHVSDNMALENMHVQLVNTSMIPVLPMVSLTPSGKSYDAVFDYSINNFRITSGNYYLEVDVSDGTNTARAYINIYVNGIPKALNGFFAATIPTPGTVDVYKCDTSWTASLFSSAPSDFTDIAVSDYWQQVYVNGSFSGPLKATSIDGSTFGFSISSIVGSVPYWGPLSVKDSRLWVTYRALNQFKSLDQLGSSNFTGNSDFGFYPKHILQNENRIFIEQKDISSSNVRMVVFSTAGGGLQETPMGVDAIEMFAKDVDNVYVIGNSLGQGHILLYDFLTNGFWEPISLPVGTTTSATQIDANTLLIGMSNGSIYKFTYNPVGLLTWTSGINPTQIRYDEVNAEIYAAEGTNVKIYNLNPFSLQRTVLLPDSVRDLELWHNW
ncbi:MAG: hypothetical protein NT084_14780 [Bacteroidetes bacterium]|nr:hypothetical protein [Bacteroidota bacterium]